MVEWLGASQVSKSKGEFICGSWSERGKSKIRYQVKSNDNFFIRWNEEAENATQGNTMTYEMI